MNRYEAMRASWLGRSTITAKLVAIVVVFVVVISAVIGLFVLGHSVSTGVRAYISGEGLWSKGQKDAVYALSRYLQTRDQRDYQTYLASIALPLGDRQARLEMEKPVFDEALVTAGFVQGGIAAADVPPMIFLFRHFDSLPFFAKAIKLWRVAEQELLQLPILAEAAHEAITAGRLTPAEQASGLARIEQINARVTPLEQQFSQVLSAGAREVQALLLYSTLATAVALIAFGTLFAFSIGRDLHTSIIGLRDGAMRVARGDLSQPIMVRSADELGELAQVFNEMMTARHEAETLLHSANEFSEKVMENSTNAIYTMNPEGHFTSANKRTCEMTGYPLAELLGKPWDSMMRAADLPELHAGFVSTLEGKSPLINREVAMQKKDGSWFIITFSIAPLSRDGVVFAVVGAAEDITERKRDETELKTRAEELSRSNRELEQFAYVASHDLQEPLRTVTGFAQLLSRRYQGKLGDEADEFIGFINSGVARMKSLIEDLLAYSRVQREARSLALVSLDKVVATAIANLGGAIAAAGARVSYTPLPTLAIDTGQFAQLFQNLIGNALKFRGDSAPVVRISAEQREHDWLFSVADNGIGIDAASAERVFLLFQRLHTRDRYEGNGIGLTICKKIIELHGGRIWVEPTAAGAHGSTFCFTLPLAA